MARSNFKVAKKKSGEKEAFGWCLHWNGIRDMEAS